VLVIANQVNISKITILQAQGQIKDAKIRALQEQIKEDGCQSVYIAPEGGNTAEVGYPTGG